MTGGRARVWLERGGLVLGIAGVAFIVDRLLAIDPAVLGTATSRIGWPLLALLTGVTIANTFLLALIWQRCLAAVSIAATTRWAVETFGRAQIGKYIPGNIFHLAAMFSAGAQSGLPPKAAGLSIGYQQVAIVLGGLPFALVGAIAFVTGQASWLAAGAALAVLAVAVALAARRVPGLARTLSLALAFHLVSGLVFVLLVRRIDAGAVPGPGQVAQFAATYVLGWLLGLVVPGAPAGLGVREAAVVAVLGAGTAVTALPAIAIMRAITISADLLYFAGAAAAMRRRPGALPGDHE